MSLKLFASVIFCVFLSATCGLCQIILPETTWFCRENGWHTQNNPPNQPVLKASECYPSYPIDQCSSSPAAYYVIGNSVYFRDGTLLNENPRNTTDQVLRIASLFSYSNATCSTICEADLYVLGYCYTNGALFQNTKCEQGYASLTAESSIGCDVPFINNYPSGNCSKRATGIEYYASVCGANVIRQDDTIRNDVGTLVNLAYVGIALTSTKIAYDIILAPIANKIWKKIKPPKPQKVQVVNGAIPL